jgi:hypothetical protein
MEAKFSMTSKLPTGWSRQRLQTWEGRTSDWLWLLLLLALFVSLGCSPEHLAFQRVAVEGVVTLDGAPLDDATICFVPLENTVGPKTMIPIVSGHFRADQANGPAAGTHRVEIELTASDEFAHDDEQAWAQLVSQKQTSGKSRVVPRQIPAIYNETSILTASLDPSETKVLEFVLKSR